MKTPILTTVLGFGLFVAGVSAQNGCENAACAYVESLAATCQEQAAGNANGPNPCLCTERFRVNLSRCLSGLICAWDGNGSPTPPICPDIYCPGSYDQNFIDQCPSVSTSGLPIPPTPTGSPGQTSSTRTNGNTSPTAQPSPGMQSPLGTTTTNTAGGASSSSSSTSSTGFASALQVPISLAGIIGLGGILLL